MVAVPLVYLWVAITTVAVAVVAPALQVEMEHQACHLVQAEQEQIHLLQELQ